MYPIIARIGFQHQSYSTCSFFRDRSSETASSRKLVKGMEKDFSSLSTIFALNFVEKKGF